MIKVSTEAWIIFNFIILILLIVDLFVLHSKDKVISVKNALLTSAVWIGLALLFNVGIYFYAGKEPALNFLAGYLIEESLSIDNLFVFLMLFKYFHTPVEYQYKVLFWGILGAILMRGIMIFGGIALINNFHWMIYIFGAFLVYTGIKMAFPKSEEIHPENNPALILLNKFFPITKTYDNGHFFTKFQQKWHATPLFAVLLAVETTDLIFALDSIPAIVSITKDPFIIYTSNIFAILGLRSLFFALSSWLSLFHFLNYGLAVILTFAGLKMLVGHFIEIPIRITLGVIILSITCAIVASKLFPQDKINKTT